MILLSDFKKLAALFERRLKRIIRLFQAEQCLVKVNEYTLKIHRDNPLRDAYSQLPFNGKYLTHLASLVEQHYPDGWIIDVGANIGDTLALLRSRSKLPVLCVEGDDHCYSYLQVNHQLFENVHIIHGFLSEQNGTVAVKVCKEGWNTTFQNPSAGQSTRTISVQKLDILLDSHPLAIKSVKLLKVDTEGYDLRILRGSRETLEKYHPVLTFELNSENLRDLGESVSSFFDYLCSEGYSEYVFFDNQGLLLCHLQALAKDQLLDLYHYTCKGQIPYCDLCVFHNIDQKLVPLFLQRVRADYQ